MKKKQQKEPAKLTVAELMEKDDVPVAIRFWLEQFTEGDSRARSPYLANTNEATLEMARFVYDVLHSKYEETGRPPHEREFSEEARDYVAEFIYRMAEDGDVQLWNDPDIAVAALPTLLDVTSGSCGCSPELTLLRAGVERLATRRELREFLRDGKERYAQDDEAERINEAGFKLSRVLADPRTPEETRAELENAMNEFSMSSQVTVYHPALARRAFLLMCEAKPRGRGMRSKKEMQLDRGKLFALLDSIPEEKGGDE